jgi:signal transduction histidine kinase
MKIDSIKCFSAFPIKDISESLNPPSDGILLKTNNFCKKKFSSGNQCKDFYRSLEHKKPGFYKCPFGYSAYKCSILEDEFAISSIIPLPRDSSNRTKEEDTQLKNHPSSGIPREAILAMVEAFEGMKKIHSDLKKHALQKLPHALHEIRKLNGAIKSEAETLTEETNDPRALTIVSASEFMTVQFEYLDLLINESITQLKIKNKSQIDALVYKCIKIFKTKAQEKKIKIEFSKRDTISVDCCDKTLPIIITILIDNAIRYSPEKTTVKVSTIRDKDKAYVIIGNEGEMKLSEERMFIKYERGVTNIEGSGYGLYFAKKIAEQHHGQLTYSSADNHVIFKFELPARK